MAQESGSIRVNKVFVGIFTTLSLSVISAAAKSYIDVVELKTKVDNYADNQKELKEDLRVIKEDIKTLLSKGG